MSKCELTIELDDPKEAYRPGDVITGRVLVDVNASCACKALTIKRRFATHGRGNPATGGSVSQTLFEGEWKAGQTHSYEFSLSLPDGPYTYRGKLLNVDWALVAAADIPWAFDPKASRGFRLEGPPLPDAAPEYYGKHLDPTAAAAVSKVGKVVGFVVAGCFIVPFLGGAVIVGITGLVEGEIGALIGSGIMFLIAALITILVLRNAMAKQALGEVVAKVEPRVVTPGGELLVSIAFTPKRNVALNKIKATLKAQEVVTRGHGTNRHTYRHKLFEETGLLSEAQGIRPGEPVAMEYRFPVPADAAASFTARDNALSWTVALSVDIARWPDWNGSFPVTVIPADVAAAAGAAELVSPVGAAAPELPPAGVDGYPLDDVINIVDES